MKLLGVLTRIVLWQVVRYSWNTKVNLGWPLLCTCAASTILVITATVGLVKVVRVLTLEALTRESRSAG